MTLETQTCGRCGGSGEYSYCSGYGTRCFKCHGRKVVFSKRGAAANAFLIRLRSRLTHEIKPGMLVFSEGFACGSIVQPSKFHKVLSVSEPKIIGKSLRDGQWVDNIGVTIEGECWSLGTVENTIHRVGHTALGKRETFALALAYQSKLTKSGKLKAGEAEITAEGILRITDTTGWLVGQEAPETGQSCRTEAAELPAPPAAPQQVRNNVFTLPAAQCLQIATSALSGAAWFEGGYASTGA